MTASEPSNPTTWPSVATDRVRVVGVNPAMDRLQVIDSLHAGGVHRATSVTARAGGKSFIVARTIRRRDVDVTMYGFLGGPVGDLASAECEQLGIDDRHTRIVESTRITPVIVEAATGRSTVINEPGPLIRGDEIEALLQGFRADVGPGDLVVCTGSLPRGVDPGLYHELVREASSRGALVAVDASGEPLARALEAAPWFVKCNGAEFAGAFSIPHDGGDAAIVSGMLEQIARGTALVVVTMGPSAFLVASAEGVWRVRVPDTIVVNATGSGDTFLGCFMAAAARGASLADALRDATAGGVVNAGQLEAGLQAGAVLEPYRSRVDFHPDGAPVMMS